MHNQDTIMYKSCKTHICTCKGYHLFNFEEKAKKYKKIFTQGLKLQTVRHQCDYNFKALKIHFVNQITRIP